MNRGPEDFELISKIRNDDETAFAALYEAYWKPLFVMAFNRLKDVKEAEDLTADLFSDLWRKRHDLVIHTSVEAYLAVSARHRVMDAFRRRKRREAGYEQAAGMYAVSFNHVEEQHDFEELYRLWQNEVNRLPEQCRLVYVLSQDEEMTTKEIASKLNISERTVENHKYRALKILKIKLTFYIILAVILS